MTDMLRTDGHGHRIPIHSPQPPLPTLIPKEHLKRSISHFSNCAFWTNGLTDQRTNNDYATKNR